MGKCFVFRKSEKKKSDLQKPQKDMIESSSKTKFVLETQLKKER